MERMKLEQAQEMIQARLDEGLAAAAAKEKDRNRARLLGTLYARQKGAADCLSLVRIDRPEGPGTDGGPLWLRIVMHPLLGTALAVALLLCVVNKWHTEGIVLSVALLLRFLMEVAVQAVLGEKRSLVEVHEPYVLRSEAEHFVSQQETNIQIDVSGIGGQYAVTATAEQRSLTQDLVQLYIELYQGWVDAGDSDEQKSVLSYALTTLRADLNALGYEPVMYAEETRALFDSLPGGHQRPSHMRYPAIVDAKTGLLLERGLYIRQA